VLDRHLDMIEREHAFLAIGTARSAPPPLTLVARARPDVGD
jgi:hypothetical protein